MVIRSVTITHLRSHERTQLHCASDVTILSGPNGSGKTSLLEAISLCSMGRTFVPVPDLSLIQRGQEACRAAVSAVSDHDVPYRVSVDLVHGQRKKIESNQSNNLTARELIGTLPVVALSPDHKGITFGGPSERRAFIDAVMAQSSRAYTDLLYEHRRVLKQRNAILAERGSGKRNDLAELAVWTQTFIEISAEIVERRMAFLADLLPIVMEEYAAVAGVHEEIGIVYQPDHVDAARNEITKQFQIEADRLAEAERLRGVTLFGPQKDEVVFTINERLVRETASQGQHKSLLIALKISECRMLLERRRERPVVLLDDVFAELDNTRSARVLARIRELGMQCFVTTTEEERFRTLTMGDQVGLVGLESGRIVSSSLGTSQEQPS